MSIVVATLLYKIASLFCGTAICWMGYRLFSEGVFHSAGDVNATFSDSRLMIKRGAPGTFFVVFGCAVLVATLVRGISFGKPDGQSTGAQTNLAFYAAGLGHTAGFASQDNARALHFAYSRFQSDPSTKADFAKFEALKLMRDGILREKFDEDVLAAFHKAQDETASLTAEEQTKANTVNTWLSHK